MLKVKICGITNPADAEAAVTFGADALGFVFYPKSPRHVTPEQAREIIRPLPPFIITVGVFVNTPPEEVETIMKLAGLDIAQFHGDESPEDCIIKNKAIKSFRVRSMSDLDTLKEYAVSAYLLDAFSEDAFGGTGRSFNWDIAHEARQFGRIILAGGLRPENVQDAINHAKPYAVDVSSGVEAEKGRKDHDKLRRFIENAKSAGQTPA